jgi:hypothetical protein
MKGALVGQVGTALPLLEHPGQTKPSNEVCAMLADKGIVR